MIGTVDTGLEFYRQVLELRAYRQEILTADIANASTPGFKAVDLDFRQALDAATSKRGLPGAARPSGSDWVVDDPRHIRLIRGASSPTAAASVKYQIGSAVSLDGNSVDLNQEKVTAAENAVQYEAAASFASQIIKMLTIAINGSGPQQSSGA